MIYVLPRALMVLIVWGMTCGLIKSLWPAADPLVFAVAGAFLTLGGVAYFAYLRKLRHDIEQLETHWRFRADHGAIKASTAPGGAAIDQASA